MEFTWRVPIGKKVTTDPYEFTLEGLAEYLAIPEWGLGADLKGDDGSVYGSFTINSNGEVEIKFNYEYEGTDNAKGDFWFESSVSKEKIKELVVIPQFIIKVDEEVKNYEVPLKGEGTSIDKAGHPNKEVGADQINWSVDINKDKREINASITEDFGTDLEFISVEVVKLNVNILGDVIGEGATVDPTEYTISEDGTLLELGVITEPYRIKYVTSIGENARVVGEIVTLENNATLNDGSKDYDASASVAVSFAELIDKSATYDATQQLIDWVIKYNANENSIIQASALIKDELSENAYYVEDSFIVYEISGYEEGKPIRTTVDSSKYDLNIIRELSEGKIKQFFTLQFVDDINSAYEIEYQTRNAVHITESTGIEVTNKLTSGTKTIEKSTTMNQQTIVKSDPVIDYNAMTADWTIVVNGTGLEVLNDLSVGDRLQSGITLISGSIEVKDADGIPVSPALYALYPKGGTSSNAAKDTYHQNDDFWVHFLGQIDEPIYITYKTDIARSALDTIENNAKGHFKYGIGTYPFPGEDGGPGGPGSEQGPIPGDGGYITISDDRHFEPEQKIKDNGSKSGSYNPIEKKITWSIYVNYVQNQLIGASVTDEILPLEVTVGTKTFSSVPKFVNGSISVKYFTIDAAGIVTIGDDVPAANYEAKMEEIGGIETVTVNINESSDKSILVQFETSLEDDFIFGEYENTATFTNDGKSIPLEASVQPDFGNSFAIKDGKQTGASKISWNVKVNYSQSKIEDFEVYDELGPDLIYVDGSLKIYPVSVVEAGEDWEYIKSDETIEADKYTLTTDRDMLTGISWLKVRFNETINTPYIIEYDTTFIAGNGDTISNKVSVKGGEYELIETPVEKEIIVITSQAGGSGSSNRGSLVITKVGEGNSHLFEGLKFDLYTILNDKRTLIRSGVTNEHGILKFEQLRNGTYYLVEDVEANDALIDEEYVVGEDEFDGIEIVINNEHNDHALNKKEITVTNYIPKLELTKSFVPAVQDFSAVKFDVFKASKAGDGTVTVETPALHSGLTLDAQGKLIVTDGIELNQGYVIRETHTVAGYIRYTGDIYFEPITHGSHKAGVSANTLVNYQGSAQIHKSTAAGGNLAGAVFGVYRTSDNSQVLTVTSDSSGYATTGRVLEHGDYFFKEITPAPNYIVNPTEINFTISAETTQTTPDIVSAGTLSNFQGFAEFTKTNKDNELLSGAVFSIYRINEGEVEDSWVRDVASGSDGVVSSGGLGSGDYYFLEKTAPAGYLPRSTILYFSVLASASTQPENSTLYTDKEMTEPFTGNFVNYQLNIHFDKVDENEEPLAGATFDLYRGTELLQTDLAAVKVGDTYTFMVTGLAVGTYRLVETTAPGGYVKNTIEFTVTLEMMAVTANTGDIDYSNHFDLVNYKGALEFKKEYPGVGTVTGKSEFNVYLKTDIEKENPIVVSYNETESKYYLDGLAPGTYILVEESAPEGFIKNLKEYEFTINETYTGKQIIDLGTLNNYQGSVTVQKVGENGNNLNFAGIEFTVYNNSDDTFVASGVTDSTGKVVITGLMPGVTYYVKETSLPDGTGYILNTQKSATFTVPSDLNHEWNVRPTVDISFTNYQGSVELTKKSYAGDALAGVKYDLYLADSGAPERILSNLTTGPDGKLAVENLAPGSYYFLETETVDGHILNTEKVEFIISPSAEGEPDIVSVNATNYKGSLEIKKYKEDGETLLAGAVFEVQHANGTPVADQAVKEENGVTIITNLPVGQYILVEKTPAPGYIRNTLTFDVVIDDSEEGQPEVIEYEMSNYRGSASINKGDALGNPLEGVEFVVLDENKNIVQTIYTDANGVALAEELAPGAYTFQETKSVDGHIINTTTYDFEIVEEALNDQDIIHVTIETQHLNYKGSLTFRKTDRDGILLEGAEFIVTDQNSREVTAVKIEEVEPGIFEITNIPAGTFNLVEVKAPSGYVINANKVEFTIDQSHEGKPEMLELGDIVNYKGSIRVTKIDAKNQPLEGVTFDLLDRAGTILRSNLVTDKNGVITVNNLSPGTYFFKETSTVSGHILNTDLVEVAVSSSSAGIPSVSSNIHINYFGSVALVKSDENTGKLISGAVFDLYDKEDNLLLKDLVTNEDGEIVINDLAVGEYYFVETLAPKGYLLTQNEAIPFEIEETFAGEPTTIGLSVTNKSFIEVLLGGQKKLLNADLKDGSFEFELIDDKGLLIQKLSHLANGDILFEPIVFDAIGEYSYTLREVKGNEPGIIYDESVFEITVRVTDDGEGNLHATVVYPGKGVPEFRNVFSQELLDSLIPDTPEPEESKPNAPKTGEDNPLSLLGILLLTAGLALGAYTWQSYRTRKRRKNSES